LPAVTVAGNRQRATKPVRKEHQVKIIRRTLKIRTVEITRAGRDAAGEPLTHCPLCNSHLELTPVGGRRTDLAKIEHRGHLPGDPDDPSDADEPVDDNI